LRDQIKLLKKYNIANDTIETFLTKNDGLDSPQVITVDSSGDLYIGETNKIVKYTASTQEIVTLIENISNPNDIAVHNGIVYFTHGDKKTVEMIESTTTLSGTTPSSNGEYDVNLSVTDGGETSYQNFQIIAGNILDISPTISIGTVDTATQIIYTPSNGNSLKYMFSNSSITNLVYGDNINDIQGAINYTSGTNIENATAGKYLVVYEVDSEGKILGFYQKILDSSDILKTIIYPKLIQTIEDQLIDVNTSKFVETNSSEFNLTSYFEHTKRYSFKEKEVEGDHNITDWLDLNITTGILKIKSGFENNASLLNPGKYYIQTTGDGDSDTNATGFFTLRVKNLNAGLSEYIDSNITGQETGTGKDDNNRTYAETNATVESKDIQLRVYTDGSASYNIKDVATAESKLPDSKVKAALNGDLNTTTSTINDDGQIVHIEVLGKVTGDIKAEHTLTLEDGNITKAISKVANTITTVRTDRVVETNATVGSNEISVLAQPDGKANHRVKIGQEISRANVDLPGAQTTIEDDGKVETKLPTEVSDKNCTGSYYAEVVTTKNGENITKFRNDGETCYTAPTLIDGEEFPVGSESNITKDTSNIIHIQTTTPELSADTQFTIE